MICQDEINRVARELGLRQKLKVVTRRHIPTPSRDEGLKNLPEGSYTRGVYSFYGWEKDNRRVIHKHRIVLLRGKTESELLNTLAHEVCHALQYERGEVHDNAIPYRERPWELEAQEFAKRHADRFERVVIR